MSAVKERPQIYAGDSVCAILEGRKTKTRRVFSGTQLRPADKGDRLWVRESWRAPQRLDSEAPVTIARLSRDAGYDAPWCPVRYTADGRERDGAVFRDTFGGEWGRLRAAMHMPRWASRILLEVCDVRAEHLQEITIADILAEGVRVPDVDYTVPEDPRVLDHEREAYARARFAELWDRLNARRGFAWSTNPYVWRIEFRLLEVR